MNYWITHFIDKVKLTDSSHQHSSPIWIAHIVRKAFRSPTIVISTVEVSDFSLSLLLHKAHYTSKEPLCDVVIASVDMNYQFLEPEDYNGNDQRAIRYVLS